VYSLAHSFPSCSAYTINFDFPSLFIVSPFGCVRSSLLTLL
jgi:hypothetical protein